LEILETGVILVTVQPGNKAPTNAPKPKTGISSSIVMHAVRSEEELLRRVSSVVRAIDPDSLVSWDTQGAGIGYLIERGCVLGKPKDGEDGIVVSKQKIDMVRLLGRTPKARQSDASSSDKPIDNEFILNLNDESKENELLWVGSGLGSEWDDRVGKCFV
jgi:DNA polymerase elongation subunit (family B)